MAILSQDVIANILSRLPVKSLCRFRCVSKSWLHLTTQPHFIQTHLNRAHSEKLILSSHSLFSLDHLAPIDDDFLPVELDFPLKEEGLHWVQMFGSCNGLVCIMPIPQALFIFNPSTRESMRVPDCPMPAHVCPQQEQGFEFDGHLLSFGYAPCIDDYKVVKVAYGCMVLVFSLRNNSWRRVQDLPCKHLLNGRGTVLNGAVHCLCGPFGVGGPCVIAAFDLAEEKFSVLATPDSVRDYRRFMTGSLGGCLCVLHNHVHNRQHSFWIMKEYNVKESWTRILISDLYFSLEPICYWKNTKILLVRNREQLLLCNTKDGTCKDFLVKGLPSPLYADVYVESLVSPNFQQN